MTSTTSVEFTATERAALENLPQSDLVDIAVELDIVVPARIDVGGLFAAIVQSLIERAPTHGLPLSAYDRDELEALEPAELAAVARLCAAPATIDGLIKQGAKSSKRYRDGRPQSAVVLIVPTLLAPLARAAARRG